MLYLRSLCIFALLFAFSGCGDGGTSHLSSAVPSTYTTDWQIDECSLQLIADLQSAMEADPDLGPAITKSIIHRMQPGANFDQDLLFAAFAQAADELAMTPIEEIYMTLKMANESKGDFLALTINEVTGVEDFGPWQASHLALQTYYDVAVNSLGHDPSLYQCDASSRVKAITTSEELFYHLKPALLVFRMGPPRYDGREPFYAMLAWNVGLNGTQAHAAKAKLYTQAKSGHSWSWKVFGYLGAAMEAEGLASIGSCGD